jgi:DNA repair exonuclease SbcCD nuclease subunit
MFHIRGRVNTVVYNAIYDTMKTYHEHGLEVIGIAGNHDQWDNSDVPEHSLHTFNDLEGVKIFKDLGTEILWGYDKEPDVTIFCVPYSKNAQRIKDWIASIDFDNNPQLANSICLFHLGISGAFVGNGSYPMADAFKPEDLRPDKFKYVIGGHFHRRQMIDKYLNFWYTGAPIQHSFGDEGEPKGYLIIDTDKRCDIQFVAIPNPRFTTMTAYDVANENMVDMANNGDYVRLMVKEDELQTALTYLPPGLKYKTVLEKSYEEQNRIDVKIGMTEEQVVTKYAQEHNPDALEVGLKILEEVKGNVH